jgi:2-amino-4-hydroxy-6-hydroxymethyldihydropteridine diphosphokinase
VNARPTLHPSTVAFIALGSSLSPREQTLASARHALAALPCACGGLRASPVYETSPVGPAAHPFLNQVVALDVALAEPARLLGDLLAIEAAHGRTRALHWGDRTLDLDLLFFADLVTDEPACVLPHPRLHERDFVLVPLCDLAPDLVHPRLKRPVRDLLADLATPRTILRRL